MKKSIFLCLLILAMIFTSCTGKQPDGTDTTETNETEDTSREVVLVDNKKAAYKIVYPEDCSSQLSVAADMLRSKLNTLTGCPFTSRTDSTQGNAVIDSTGEIIIGNCKRTEMQNALATLTYRDYAVIVTDSNILIAGYEDSKVVDAVYSFINQLTDETLVSSEGSTILKWSGNYQKLYDSYKFESLTVGDVSLSEYHIVYPSAANVDEYMLECAKALQNNIGRRCGAYVPIVSDAEAAQPHEILLGKTNREESTQYYASENAPKTLECGITVRNEKLLIACGNIFSLSASIAKFDSCLTSSKDGKLDSLNLERVSLKNANMPAVNGDYRMMSYNVMHHADGWAPDELLALPFVTRAANVAAQINSYAPDVLFLQERHDEWAGIGKGSVDLDAVLGDEYVLVADQITYQVSGGGTETVTNRSPLIYNSNTFKLVDSGYKILTEETTTQASSNKRVVTWAVLEDITNTENKGQKIAVFGTHWSISTHWSTGASIENIRQTQSAEVQSTIQSVLNKHGDMPVVFGGDLNMMYEHATYQSFLSNAGLKDADATVNGADDVQRIVDHIAIADADINAYKKVDTTNCSDHWPIWCDIKISKQ